MLEVQKTRYCSCGVARNKGFRVQIDLSGHDVFFAIKLHWELLWLHQSWQVIVRGMMLNSVQRYSADSV